MAAREWGVLDGALLPLAEARISALERGFLHGEGLFETIRIEAGEPMALPAHLARLASSCAALGMPAPPPAALIAEEASRLVRLAPTGGLVRFTWSAGPADAPGPDDPPRGPSRLLTWRPGARLSPVALHPLSFRPGEHAAHKTTARWPYHRARVAARAAGSDDALLVDRDGSVLETTSANVFVRSGDAWATPPADGRILPGIARAALLARDPRIAERPLTVAELLAADAVWLVGASLTGPRPVARVGDQRWCAVAGCPPGAKSGDPGLGCA